MAIKIVLGTIAYLLCGTATLAVMKWHDRHHSGIFERWLGFDDTFEDSMVTNYCRNCGARMNGTNNS